MIVKISKLMNITLKYSDFDVEEVKSTLPKLFPDARIIKLTYCEDNWLEVLVDGEYYTINATGDIIDGKVQKGEMNIKW